MKNGMTRFFLAIVLFSAFNFFAFSQTPQGIPYQAIARNSNGSIVVAVPISLRFSIHDSIANGPIKYRETFSVTTSSLGLFNVNIGQGTPVLGSFTSINWGQNAKFMQVEMDPNGGNNYLDFGTTQMMSVPYAKYAEVSGTTLGGGGGWSHFVGEVWGGGVIYHVYRGVDGNEHGLIVALSDQSTQTPWSNITTDSIGVSARSSWNGFANSNAIVSQVGHTNSAAKLCLDLVSGGFDDWYLPSRLELNLLYDAQYHVNKTLSGINGATELSTNDFYWSSSEEKANFAWAVSFSGGTKYISSKHATLTSNVRAIRSF